MNWSNSLKLSTSLSIRNGSIAAGFMLAALALPVLAAAPDAKYKTLFTFDDSNGANPLSDLLADKAGNLYGTALAGGAANEGAVFKLAPNGTETVLYSFTGGDDGAKPDGPLAEDEAGNFYGAAAEGGNSGYGVIFKIAPDGTETVLHSFSGAIDGGNPNGGVLMGKHGILYGTTSEGGSNNYGVVFAFHPSGKFEVLHTFAGGANDGQAPLAGVIQDKDGNLYGTTDEGGYAKNYPPPCCGTVYEITKDGAFKLLHSFQYDADGAGPVSPPMLDSAGNLYGTTTVGGNPGFGVVYKVTPAGSESVLYAFVYGPNDGASPFSALIGDKQGNLYGTTTVGGADDYGIVFKVTPDGTETVLHSFTQADGVTPYGGLIRDPALGQDLYGTTSGLVCGGCNTYGSIYKIKK